MDTKKIEKLIQIMKKHELHEMEVESEGHRVRLTTSAATPMAAPVPMTQAMAAPAPAAAALSAAPAASDSAGSAHDNLPADKQIRSPFVGTFYEAATPGADPFVKVGQRVKAGDTLCIIEAMKIMNEIEAERDGTIKEILVSNGQAIEFDQLIFVVE